MIHAGLYYPQDSLKTALCIEGNRLLYPFMEKNRIPYKNIGKWIVAQDDRQAEYLQSMARKAKDLEVPTRFLSPEQIKLEPLLRAHQVLESTSTGIMDSHALMQFLHGQFSNAGGDTVYNTEITGITKNGHYSIHTKHGDDVTTDCVINSAGLSAVSISNMLLPPTKQYYAKGQYYAYSGRGPSRLIYPCPEPDLAGLGTHLTLDLSGAIKFGPDVEWIDAPDYHVTSERLSDAIDAIKQYFPTMDASLLTPSYAGVRPKLSKSAASDFHIKEDLPGFINLMGIESPGLTSCLAIARYVDKLL